MFKPYGRIAFVWALIVLFGLLSIQAGREALSDIYLLSAKQAAGRTVSGPAAKAEQWRQVRQNLDLSLRYLPRNPHALMEAGRHDLIGLTASVHPDGLNRAARSAYENFRLALTQQPTASDAWINAALAKYYSEELGPEMFEALRNADELGPWEQGVQRVTLSMGLLTWGRLGEEERAATDRTLERAASRDAAFARGMFLIANRGQGLCNPPIKYPTMNAMCSELRKFFARPKPRAR